MRRPPDRPARGIVVQPSTAPPATHARFAPPTELADQVEHFWRVAWALPPGESLRPQTLPHPSVHVTFEGVKHEVSGIHTKRFERTLEGTGRVFAIKFRPGTFRALLGRDVGTIAERVLPIEEVFGDAGAQLGRAIVDEPSDEGCLVLAESFLRERVRPLEAAAREARDLVERAANDRSIVAVEELARLAGTHVRALQRLFARHVGATPKWVLQRYRLHEANERLKADPRTNLVELAISLGYADQAHFARDFKALVGLAPAAYARRVKG